MVSVSIEAVIKAITLNLSCLNLVLYTLFKAVRIGYIDPSYLEVAIKGYKGILNNFIEVDKIGLVSIAKACAVAGLGGKELPFRRL